MFLIVTASVTSDGTLSLMVLAASSDSKTTMLNPPSSPRVQYPATNPGACDTPGTTFSRNWLVAASRSLTVTVTTTACMGVSFCRWLARTLSGSQRDDRLTAVLAHRPRTISLLPQPGGLLIRPIDEADAPPLALEAELAPAASHADWRSPISDRPGPGSR